jgi:S1-C subfamily serine protease
MRVDALHLNYSLRLSDTVRVGPLELDRPVVGNSVSVNLFGQEFLHHFAVTFDARNDLVRFTREGVGIETPLSSPPLLGTGYTVHPLEDVQVVLDVLAESPAARAGLEVGDTIMAVDGVSVEDLTCRNPGDARPREPDPVLLSVRKEGEAQEISVPRAVVVR